MVLSKRLTAGMRQRSLLMTVRSVGMDSWTFITFKNKDVSRALFAGMYTARLRIWSNWRHLLLRMVIEIGFSMHFYT